MQVNDLKKYQEFGTEKDLTHQLFKAVENGSVQEAQKLIDQGAEIDQKDTDGRSPLFKAIFLDNLDMSHLLIKNGADLETKNKLS